MSLSNQEIGHMFAHGWGDGRSEKNGSNFFVVDNSREGFTKRTAYSYRYSWPLAIFFQREGEDAPIVIMNATRYSVSTTQHFNHVLSALPMWYRKHWLDLNSESEVGNVMDFIDRILRGLSWDTEDNVLVKQFKYSLEYFTDSVSTKTRLTQKIELAYATLGGNHRAYNAIYTYLNAGPFPVTLPSLDSFFTEDAVQDRKLKASREKKVANFMAAVRANVSAARHQLLAAMSNQFDIDNTDLSIDRMMPTLKEHRDRLYSIHQEYLTQAITLDVDDLLSTLTNYSRFDNELDCRHVIDTCFGIYCDEKKHRAEIIDWRLGRRSGFSYGNVFAKNPLLRIVQHDNYFEVQTSKGARVPESTVKLVWAVLLRMNRKGTMFYENTTVKVPPYSGIIVEFGTKVTVGCHELPWEEIEYIRQQLGWEWSSNEEE